MSLGLRVFGGMAVALQLGKPGLLNIPQVLCVVPRRGPRGQDRDDDRCDHKTEYDRQLGPWNRKRLGRRIEHPGQQFD